MRNEFFSYVNKSHGLGRDANKQGEKGQYVEFFLHKKRIVNASHVPANYADKNCERGQSCDRSRTTWILIKFVTMNSEVPIG